MKLKTILTIVTGLFLVLVLYQIFGEPNRPEQESITEAQYPDITAPESCQAILTLSGGNFRQLDSMQMGETVHDAGVVIQKTAEGELKYRLGNTRTKNPGLTHMLLNPKGSRVAVVTLADGSKVWLNNESSLRYGVDFGSRERLVELTGEAYFEVVHDPNRKFIIKCLEFSMSTDGGRFHINHYQDEVTKWMNMIEGSGLMTVSFGHKPTGRVKAGQQAQANHGTLLNIIDSLNEEKVLAWKNQKFYFTQDDIKSVMLQVARWYDVNPVFRVLSGAKINGDFSRNEPLSAILAELEKQTTLRFEIQGKDVIITSATGN